MPGISLAPDDPAMNATPAWERIDTAYNVQSFTIDRGRASEMSRTDTGTAHIELIDKTGAFDPTNPSGHFYGRLTAGVPMGPLVQAKIELQNPLTSVWTTLFRGFISTIQWVPYRREDHANVSLELVDGLAYLAACEMAPDGSFGDEVFEGNIVFHENLTIGTGGAMQTRMNLVLDQADWPTSLREIFTGNVALQETVYAPRSTVLSVIQDAADAEFPDVSNVYIGGPRSPGNLVFHGRLARFNPADTQYNIQRWNTGDDAAAALDTANVCRLSPPLLASLDDTLLYTSALATPQNINDADIAAQYVTNTAAAALKGLRTWSAENLATRGGVGTTGEAECRKFANYIRDNYGSPKVRVGQLTIKSRNVTSVSAAATWNLICKIDISDIVHVKTTHTGGGGFNHDFYVEGIHYVARPGPGVPYIELTLDVSPKGYYDVNPF